MHQEKNIKKAVYISELAKTQMQKLGLSDVIFLKISSQTKLVLLFPKGPYFLSEYLKTSNKK